MVRICRAGILKRVLIQAKRGARLEIVSQRVSEACGYLAHGFADGGTISCSVRGGSCSGPL